MSGYVDDLEALKLMIWADFVPSIEGKICGKAL